MILKIFKKQCPDKKFKLNLFFLHKKELKGIVSQDFGGLQMILINRLCVPDVPLEVYSFLNLHLHIFF